MEIFYFATFALIAITCGSLELRKRAAPDKGYKDNVPFLNFRNNYLVVYCLMMAGDWLQGPYVYALYQHYGYQVADIGRLFIAGFGSSMVFGTIAGTLADRHGRKVFALLYIVTYTLSCATKHWSEYNVLMLGRVFGGIATSLLFSVFESWLVAEHMKRGYAEDWLGDTFSKAVQLGNGLVAIAAGLLANFLVEYLQLGFVAPFDAAAMLLAIGGAIIMWSWPENHGECSMGKGPIELLHAAVSCIAADQRMLLLGVIQALFEGAMYTFVLLWTPALSPGGEHIPHGFIFAMFMLSSMAGSTVAGQLLANNHRPERYMSWVFFLSSVCLAVPIVFHLGAPPDSTIETTSGITGAGMLQCIAFCVFEGLVGMFWPSMMTMRAHYLPDELRTTLINIFRIPLNIFVCAVLYNVSKFPLAVMFALCSGFMLVALMCQRQLLALTKFDRSGNKDDSGLLDDV